MKADLKLLIYANNGKSRHAGFLSHTKSMQFIAPLQAGSSWCKAVYLHKSLYIHCSDCLVNVFDHMAGKRTKKIPCLSCDFKIQNKFNVQSCCFFSFENYVSTKKEQIR